MSAPNSSRMLKPVSSTSRISSRKKPSGRHAAQAIAQATIATHGAPVFGRCRVNVRGRYPSPAITAGSLVNESIRLPNVPAAPIMPAAAIARASIVPPSAWPASTQLPVVHNPGSSRATATAITGSRVTDDHQRHRPEHGQRVGRLGAVDFIGNRGQIVPTHVVPHGDNDPALQIQRMERCP